MDIQQYISSGIIEAYVLGMASDEEIRELELLSTQHPEIMAAIISSKRDVAAYTHMHTIEPPAGLKEQIWSVLEKENNAVVPNQTVSMLPDNHLSDERKGRKISLYRNWAAAAFALLIGSIVLNFIFWDKARTKEQELTDVKAEKENIAASQQSYALQLEQSNKNILLLLNPDMKSVVLPGVGKHLGSSAVLLWDVKSKDVYLSLKGLPPPPSGKQYQLWAIVDGKPVDAGIYVLNPKDVLQKMKVIPNAQMFAVTVENEGGSPTPTLTEMIVAGKV